ncbi:MAG: hypothetical protein QW303_01830 [Nitrososphaerota archaeon]
MSTNETYVNDRLEASSSESSELDEKWIIKPGHILKGEYLLLKKIGGGSNASVWMTYHLFSRKFFAIKIQDHQCYEDGCREIVIIQKINEYIKNHGDKEVHCVEMLDYFVYEIDDGKRFVCSIYPLYAGSLDIILERGKYKYGLPISVVKKITKQLLKTIDFLHSELKIIHTDIKPENILFQGTLKYQSKIVELFILSGFQERFENLQKTYPDGGEIFWEEVRKLACKSVEEICNLGKYINPEIEFVPDNWYEMDDDGIIEGEDDELSDSEDSGWSSEEVNIVNTRKQSVDDLLEFLEYREIHDLEKSYDFVSELNNRANGKTSDKREIADDQYILNCRTALTDFGNSYFYDKRTRNEIQDRRYRAPEVILDLNYGFSCDIWSVGCVVFELLTGFALFIPDAEPLTKDIHHLFLMEKMLGSLPLAMKKRSKRSKFLFDKKRNYHLRNVKEFSRVAIKDRLIKQFLFSEKDADEISDFLMCMLKYEPSERLTAKELLNHKWLNVQD